MLSLLYTIDIYIYIYIYTCWPFFPPVWCFCFTRGANSSIDAAVLQDSILTANSRSSLKSFPISFGWQESGAFELNYLSYSNCLLYFFHQPETHTNITTESGWILALPAIAPVRKPPLKKRIIFQITIFQASCWHVAVTSAQGSLRNPRSSTSKPSLRHWRKSATCIGKDRRRLTQMKWFETMKP